jgi:hypothetical protein
MKKLIITVLFIGAGFGGYALLHKPTPVVHATCSKTGTCNACKNCHYCKNCSQNGGTCSICR